MFRLGLVGSFSYTPREGICVFGLVVRRVGSFSYTPRGSMCHVEGWWGVSLTRPVMEPVSSFGLVVRRVGSFSYTPRAGNGLVFRRLISLSDLSGILSIYLSIW